MSAGQHMYPVTPLMRHLPQSYPTQPPPASSCQAPAASPPSQQAQAPAEAPAVLQQQEVSKAQKQKASECPHKVDLVCGTCLSTGRKSAQDKKQSDRCTGNHRLITLSLNPVSHLDMFSGAWKTGLEG